MPDYSAQLNRERSQSQKKVKIKKKSTQSNIEIGSVEWSLIFAVAIIGDIILPISALCGAIILCWHIAKFHNVPIWKILGFGSAEIISVGIFPGLFGFVLMDYLKHKGHLGKWLTKLKLA